MIEMGRSPLFPLTPQKRLAKILSLHYRLSFYLITLMPIELDRVNWSILK